MIKEHLKDKNVKKWGALICVQAVCVVLLLALVVWTRHYEPVKYVGDSLPYRLKEEHTTDLSTLSLDKGAYQFTVEYTAMTDAYCEVLYQASYGEAHGDSFVLIKEQNEKVLDVMLYEDVTSLRIISEMEELEVTSVTVQRTSALEQVGIFLLAFVFVLLDVFYYVKQNGIYEKLSREYKNVIWGIAVISLLASTPLFTNYLLRGSDLDFHMMRIEGLAAGLSEGSFPVRIQPLWINDYRYPVSVMYGDLLLYVPALLRLVGFTLQTVYKIYIFMINILTACTSYYCGKRISGNSYVGLATSVLYTLTGYRLTSMYYRTAVGEVTAAVFTPLVFLGLTLLFTDVQKDKAKEREAIGLLVVGYTGILQSHLLSFEMAIVLSAIYCLLYGKTFIQNIVKLAKTAIVTILLNFSLLIPMADYMLTQNLHIMKKEAMNMQSSGLYITQIFQTFMHGMEDGGYGIMGDVSVGAGKEVILGIGGILMSVLLLYVYLAYHSKTWEMRAKEERRTAGKIFVAALICIAMTCYFFPWEMIREIPLVGKFLASYQFAWRFSGIAIVFCVLLFAYMMKYVGDAHEKLQKSLMMVLCLLTIISSTLCLEEIMENTNATKITSAAAIDTRSAVSSGEYMREGAWAMLLNTVEPEPEEGVLVENYTKTDGVITFTCANTLEKEGYIKVPFLLYKGYRAIDTGTGEEFYMGYGDQNAALVIVPAGYSGEIEVCFREPWYWRVAEAISLLTLLGIVCDVRRVKNKKAMC